MTEHLWIKKPPPWEYVTLVLCRDVYHCTPSQLRKERASDIIEHLTCLDEEARINEAIARRQKPNA